MNCHEIQLSQVYILKRHFCVFGGVLPGSVILQSSKSGLTVNADPYCEQSVRVNQSLIENWQSAVNRKIIITQYDTAKINELRWEVLLF